MPAAAPTFQGQTNPFGSMSRVELFATGTYRGKTYAPADLDRVVANFDRLMGKGGGPVLLQPPAVIGHEEDQSWLQDSGLLAAGWVTRVWRERDKLLGSVGEVPPEVAELIRTGRVRKVSAEFYQSFLDDFGNDYGLTLRRVAFLGGEVPQVKRLADLPRVEFSERRAPRRRPVVTRLISVTGPHRGRLLTFSEVVPMDRQAMIDQLTAMGFDASKITDAIPDDVVAEILRSLQAVTPPATPPADPAMRMGEGGTTGTGGPSVAGGNAPSQVVIKYMERQEAAIRRIEGRLNTLQRESKRERVQKFCEQMVREGRLTPADLESDPAKGRMSAVDRLMLADEAQVVKFGETAKTALEWEMEQIRSKAPVVKFREQVAAAGTSGLAPGAMPADKRIALLAATPHGQAVLKREATQARK